jgi:hypothetical protein
MMRDKALIIRGLKHLRVTSVRINRQGWVTVGLMGNELPRARIKIRKHLGYVADWARKKAKIYIDDDLLKPNEIHLVALHEVVEKWVAQNFSMTAEEAHLVAEHVERDYALRRGYSWLSYQTRVGIIHARGG